MSADAPSLIRYSNGFELLFVQNRAAPVVALDLWVRVGSASEAPQEAGMAHFAEHMLFKGTERRPPGAIARDIESVGGEVNAYTSFDQTVYTAVVASRFTELGLDILSDAVFCSAFDAEELEREKKVVLEEIKRGRDLPHHYLSRLLFSEAFAVHPYGRPTIGVESTVGSFVRSDCRRFVERWYCPGNMTLVVVGDADLRDVRGKVGTLFGDRAGQSHRPRAARRREPRFRGFRGRFEARDTTDVYFELAFPGPAASHPDVPALDLLMAILGQGEASRLQHRIKLDRNLVRAVGSGAFTPRDPGLIYVGGVADPARFPEAYTAICEEVFRLRHEPVGLKELERARENLEADFVYQKETVQGQAQKAGFFHVVLGDVSAEAEYLERLRRADAGALRAVTRKYLTSSRCVLALLHPRQAAPPWPSVEAGVLTQSIEDESGRVLRSRSARRSAFSRRVLPNGARVIVKVNREVPVVAIRAAALGGTRREPENLAGAFHMMASALVKGTRTRTVYDIAHEIDAVGGQIDGFSGRNSFGLKAEFLSKYLEDGLDLFADVLCHPTFPDEEVEKVREDTLASIRLRKDNPASYCFRLFEEVLYSTHPFGRDVLGRPETVERVTAEDLRALFAAAIDPAHLAVAVAGDVDPDLVQEFLLRALEHLAPAGLLPAAPASPEIPAGSRSHWVEAPIEQAHVVVGFLGTRIQSADRHALRVASGLLSGQGGRLFRKLRDELGLAYAVTSTCVEGLDPGYMAGYIATGPENVDRSAQGLLEEFRRLAEGDAPDDEVAQAQRKLAGSFEIALQENGVQAGQMALDEIYGVGYRTFQTYARTVLSVTPAEVIGAARRYLAPGAHTMVILGPKRP